MTKTRTLGDTEKALNSLAFQDDFSKLKFKFIRRTFLARKTYIIDLNGA